MTPIKSRNLEKGIKRAHIHVNIHFPDGEPRVERVENKWNKRTPYHLSLVFFINMLYNMSI